MLKQQNFSLFYTSLLFLELNLSQQRLFQFEVSSLSSKCHSLPPQVVDLRVATVSDSEIVQVVPIVLSDNRSTALNRAFIECARI